MNNIFDEKWDCVINLGIKCNTLSLSRESGVRYFSSPFDNIDTVEGLCTVAELLTSKFEGYWDDLSDWRIENHFIRGSDEVNTKLLWHKDSPDVYYPHMNERWLTNDLTPEGLAEWKKSKDLDISSVFPDLKDVFKTRQDRLIALLESGLNLLFLRVDERKNIKRIVNNNSDEDINYFIEKVRSSFPSSNIKLLYFYCSTNEVKRKLVSTDLIEVIPVPENVDEREYVISILKTLNLEPREKVLSLGVVDSH